MENMNNEITMNEELEVTTVDEQYEVAAVESSEDSTNGGTIGKIVLGALVVVAGAAAVKYHGKIKEAIDQRRIKKLEKRGYIVMQSCDDEPEEFDFEEENCDVDSEEK